MTGIDNVLKQFRAWGRSDPEWIARSFPGTPAATAGQLWGELKLIDHSFAEDLDRINGDENLSATGKANQRRALAEKRLEQLAKLKGKFANVEESRRRAAAKAVADETEADKVAKAVQAMEIRQLLALQVTDAMKGYEVALSAVAANDAVTLDAILNSPGIWPGRPAPEHLEELRDARIQMIDPVAHAELAELTGAIEDVGNALERVEGVMRGYLPAEDEIAARASAELRGGEE